MTLQGDSVWAFDFNLKMSTLFSNMKQKKIHIFELWTDAGVAGEKYRTFFHLSSHFITFYIEFPTSTSQLWCCRPPSWSLFHSFLIFPSAVNGEVRWKAKKGGDVSVLAEGKNLKIEKDGYYFLSLRLTLFPECQCNGSPRAACTVQLSHGGHNLIEGWINTNTCSTGLLGTVVELAAGSALNFTINMSASQIVQTESLTHLAIVMLTRRPLSSHVWAPFSFWSKDTDLATCCSAAHVQTNGWLISTLESPPLGHHIAELVHREMMIWINIWQRLP